MFAMNIHRFKRIHMLKGQFIPQMTIVWVSICVARFLCRLVLIGEEMIHFSVIPGL